MKILNSSEPVSVDWKSVGYKVDSLIKLMTDKFSMTPTMSVKLTELFNINNTLPMLESIFTNAGMWVVLQFIVYGTVSLSDLEAGSGVFKIGFTHTWSHMQCLLNDSIISGKQEVHPIIFQW